MTTIDRGEPSFAVRGVLILAFVANHPDGDQVRLRVERRESGTLLFRSQAIDSSGQAGPWMTRSVMPDRKAETLERIRQLWAQSGYGEPRMESVGD